VLVFTRRRGEAIIIGGGIEVRVLRVGRDGVRLGVVAPESVPVHRQGSTRRSARRTARRPTPRPPILRAVRPSKRR
jgi:carbon storage regulator CsrA